MALADTEHQVKPASTRDLVTLPSGSVVSLKKLNVLATQHAEDCLALIPILEGKAERLHEQLRDFRAGFHSDGSRITAKRPAMPGWEKAASHALDHTRRQLSQLAHRLEVFERSEQVTRSAFEPTFARVFVEIAREHLNENTFFVIAQRARTILGIKP